jgi:hypothetical protein
MFPKRSNQEEDGMALLTDVTLGYCASVPGTRRQASFDFGKFWKGAARWDATRAVAALGGLIAASMTPAASHAAVLSTLPSDGYIFTNFDPTLTGAGVGSNANGISNTGQVVGTQVDVNNAATGDNYTGTATSNSPLTAAQGQTAFGINSAGNVVGGAPAFYLPNGGTLQPLATPATATNAFGINDHGISWGSIRRAPIRPASICQAPRARASPRSFSRLGLRRNSSTPKGSTTRG